MGKTTALIVVEATVKCSACKEHYEVSMHNGLWPDFTNMDIAGALTSFCPTCKEKNYFELLEQPLAEV